MTTFTNSLSFIILSLLFALAAAIEMVHERAPRLRFNRLLAVVVSLFALSVTVVQSLRAYPALGAHQSFALTVPALSYVDYFPFEGGRFFAVISVVLFLAAVVLCPSLPLVRVRMSRVYLMQGLLLALAYCDEMTAFLAIAIVLISGFVFSVRYHSLNNGSLGASPFSIGEDERAKLRARSFTVYQTMTVIALSISLLLRVIEPLMGLPITPEMWWFDLCVLGLASVVAVGLFPFHGWVLPFFGTPRSSIFLPMLCIQTGLLFFFRILAPLVVQHGFVASSLLPFPVVGLLYASLLFFSEQRLKRIPACLYLSHISLMALGALGLGQLGIAASMLDGVNVLIAVLGLVAVCALLTSRFGIQGVWTPTGLGVMFPELAVCYLVCVLSLVGFPGTLGFIEEELLLGHGIDHHQVLVAVVAIALTLNGFSSFRLFARVFYGQPFSARDPVTALALRERIMMLVIAALIVINGVAPAFLVRTLTALSL